MHLHSYRLKNFRRLKNYPEYLPYWQAAQKEDKRAIFSAAVHAQRAADFT